MENKQNWFVICRFCNPIVGQVLLCELDFEQVMFWGEWQIYRLQFPFYFLDSTDVDRVLPSTKVPKAGRRESYSNSHIIFSPYSAQDRSHILSKKKKKTKKQTKTQPTLLTSLPHPYKPNRHHPYCRTRHHDDPKNNSWFMKKEQISDILFFWRKISYLRSRHLVLWSLGTLTSQQRFYGSGLIT
jgi:hypothetical protein